MTAKANQIENMVRKIKSNGMNIFCKISYQTCPKTLKVSKKDGSTNPFWTNKDDIRHIVDNMTINLGTGYEKKVNGKIVSTIENDPDFISGRMKGKQAHYMPHCNLAQNMDRTKTYLCYSPTNHTTKTSRYELNGIDITEQIKPYLPEHKPISTQSAMGLDGQEQILWNTLDIENIITFTMLGTIIQ